jgi:hypothetical protein
VVVTLKTRAISPGARRLHNPLCWNGEQVQLLLSLDCSDREAIGWLATTGGVSGEMVSDLVSESPGHRFGPALVPI